MDQQDKLPPEPTIPPGKSNNPDNLGDYDLSTPAIEEVRGSLPGRMRVRIVRSAPLSFRRVYRGVLEATEAANVPQGFFGRLGYRVKRSLIGEPIATARAEDVRRTKFKALAILSANPISSVAYATEAILITLVAGGSTSLWITLPISFGIVALLGIVTFSYHQTIHAYPDGGGSYIVAKDNLGTLLSLVAAAALLVDYVLTVSVSIAAVTQTLASLFGVLAPYTVIIDIIWIITITIIYLRNEDESNRIVVLSTYLFIMSALVLIIVGCIESLFIQHQPVTDHFQYVAATQPLTLFLILKSIAAGGAALTGVEVFADDVQIFKKPVADATTTLKWMALLLGILFLGISLLAMFFHIEANPKGNPTVITQIATQVFTGPLYFMFPIFQMATLLILLTTAHTSYANFPRLAALLARDRFLPHRFAFRGDRLALSNGIIILAILASVLLIVFHGDTTQLVNLYAEGVFIAFTLSQGGMALYWFRNRQEWRTHNVALNGLGAITTLLIFLIIAITKFFEGAWIVVLLTPILVQIFLTIHSHYVHYERERTTDVPLRPQDIRHLLVVPINGLDRASLQSLAYARSISSHVTAVHVALDEEDAAKIQHDWSQWQKILLEEESTSLLVIESPYRSLIRPLLAYIDTIHQRHPKDTLTIILPEFVVTHWWELVLHNHMALRLKAALMFRPGIVVINVPQHLQDRKRTVPFHIS